MKSSANFKSHPLHPILVVFPIAFFTGTFLFDILGMVMDNATLFTVAYYMQISGIIGAVLAAVPGTIDYFKTVPPQSSGKKRATQHAFLNVTNLILFFIAWLLKDDGISFYIILALETIGIVLLSVAGWLGGTLVYRNQIGVDHRYAHAGKWHEEYAKNDQGEMEVAAADELLTDQMKLIHTRDKRIVVARTENGYVAFDDRCTHRGGSLAGGTMICGTVQCPWHGSQFDVNTGMVKAGPAKEKINSYKVIEREGKVYLDVT